MMQEDLSEEQMKEAIQNAAKQEGMERPPDGKELQVELEQSEVRKAPPPPPSPRGT